MDNRQAIVEADHKLEGIRRENRETKEGKIREIYETVPRIREIDEEIKSLGENMLKAVLSVKEAGKEIDLLKKSLPKLQKEKAELLKMNKFNEQDFDDIHNCGACLDTGFVEGNSCKCRKKMIRQIAYDKAGLRTLKHCDISGFRLDYYDEKLMEGGVSSRRNMANIVEHIMQFEEGNIFFYGESGLGKTFLSGCIAKMAMDKGKQVCYISAPAMFATLEDIKFGRDLSFEAEQMKSMIYDGDLLIIDDLGTEYVSELTTSFLFNIINSRLLNKKSTIISTNLTMNDLKDTYNERITSRLVGEYQVFKFFGRDVRLIKKYDKGST